MQYLQIIENINSSINKAVKELYNISIDAKITVPTDKSKADFVSNIPFLLSKEIKKSPIEIAKELVNKLNDKENKYFEISYAPPGFINFITTNEFLNVFIESGLGNVDSLGKLNVLENERWNVEHTSPNPNKSMHIGHLRNNVIGMSIVRMLKDCGAIVTSDCVDNNRGIAICKLMWGYLYSQYRGEGQNTDISDWVNNRNKWFTPEEKGEKPDHFFGKCYEIGSREYKKDDIKKEINDILLNWEQEDNDTYELWKYVIFEVHKGLNETLKKLNNHWDYIWHEDQHYKEGKFLVEKGLKLGIFNKLPDGAVLSDLSKYDLPDTILLKSNGTSLYITQDLALTKLKVEKYNANKLLWVIGPEQSTAMKQMFAICDQLGIADYEDLEHVSYGLVKISDGLGEAKKMSSRSGMTVLIDDLIDKTTELLLKEDRGYDREKVEKIAISAIKYELLKYSRNSDITIDLSNLVKLEGDSGVYILYTYGRINSILSKADNIEDSGNYDYSEDEKNILSELLYYPSVLQSATNDLSPNLIANYLYRLAQLFNSYYAKETILNTKDQAKKVNILRLINVIYTKCLNILGLDRIKNI